MNGRDSIDQLFATSREFEPYISDEGFTAGVMARLPAARLIPFWKECLITLAFTLVGCLVALYFFPAGQLLSSLPSSFVISPLTIGGLSALIALMAGSTCWAVETNRI